MKNLSRGMSLAELVVVSAVIGVFLIAILGLYSLHMKVIFGSPRQVKATFLSEEGLEVVKYLRNVSWGANIATLPDNTDYYLVWQGGHWGISDTGSYVDGRYDRRVRFEAVYRDVNSNITISPGTLDPDTKKVVVTTSWTEGVSTSTKRVSTYLTDLFNN
jgi:hypothetical protein